MAGRRYDPRRWKELKAAVNVPRILEAIGRLAEFRAHGRRLVGCCPIHGGDNANAFVIDLERDLWFCHTRCGVGGDSIRLAWELSGRSWLRTADWLTMLANLDPSTATPAVQGPPSGARLRSPIAERNQFRPYTRCLKLDPEHSFFRRMGLRASTLSMFEAGAWHGQGFLEGTVAVRLHDLEGSALGYAGRRLNPEDVKEYGKWKWPRGYPKGQLLYSWHRAQRYSTVDLIVVEGPWSVMKLSQTGIHNVVALGGLTVSPAQRTLLLRAERLILLLDGDPAGTEAALRMVRTGLHPNMLAIPCPEGKDPADLPEAELLQILTPAHRINENERPVA